MTNYYQQNKKQTSGKLRVSVRQKVVFGCCIMAIGLTLSPLISTVKKSTIYKEQYEKAQVANQQAVENNRVIQEEYQRVNDPDHLADVARRDYFYTKSGEIIFILPEEAER